MAKQVWRYRVRERDGTSREDHMRAESLDEVMQQLRLQQAEVVSVERVGVDDVQDRPADRRSLDRSGGRDRAAATRRVRSASRDPAPPSERAALLEPDSARPPPAPRDIPRGTTGMAGGFVLLLVGGIFTAVASVMILSGLGLLIAGQSAGWFMTLFPMIHLTVGVGLLTYALRGKAKRRAVIANGHVAMARIGETGVDRSTKINGRSPYRIGYDFEVSGFRYSGKRSTMNERITRHRVGDRIWVLYDPDDPDRNVEWPPL